MSIDVDDALYGNRGGEEEVDGVRAAIDSMRAMVDGVAVWLSALELRAAALADEAPEGEVRAQARARALARSRAHARVIMRSTRRCVLAARVPARALGSAFATPLPP